MTPLVTVVVPNYNHARFLTARLDSIFAQTLQDFELVVLDDASNDDSREIIRPYASDSRLRCEFNDKNSGSPFAQWNRGVGLARGKYVWIAESDDYANTRLLATLVEQLEHCSDVSLAFCESLIVDGEDQIRGSVRELCYPHLGETWTRDFLCREPQRVADWMFRCNVVPNASAVVFRRDAYRQVGLADANFRVCGDWLQWGKLAGASGLIFVAEPLNYFRSHSATMRHTSDVDGMYLLERLRVQHFFAAHTAVSNTARREGLAESHRIWQLLLENPEQCCPLMRQARILCLFAALHGEKCRPRVTLTGWQHAQKVLQAKQAEITALRAQLDNVLESHTWRLAQRFHRVFDWLLRR